MLRRLRRLGEEFASFSEWVRLYPEVITKEGRATLVEHLLLLGQAHRHHLDEMAGYAKRILDKKKELDEAHGD